MSYGNVTLIKIGRKFVFKEIEDCRAQFHGSFGGEIVNQQPHILLRPTLVFDVTLPKPRYL